MKEPIAIVIANIQAMVSTIMMKLSAKKENTANSPFERLEIASRLLSRYCRTERTAGRIKDSRGNAHLLVF